MKSALTEDLFHLGIKALIRSHGKVLLLQFNPERVPGNVWDLPGGRVKLGETVAAALERETREELGSVILSIGRHIGMTLSNIRILQANNHDVGLILSVYECSIPDNTSITLSEDHTQSSWFTPTQAAELLRTKYSQDFCDLLERI